MRNRTVIFILLCAALASCSYPELNFEKASGQANKVQEGDKFRISVPEDHSTHYLWALQNDLSGKTVEYMGSVFHGSYVDFNFTAIGKGREELTLYLYRAKDTAQVKKFVVEVE